MPTNDRIVVGVDFGTTFTGVSMVWSETPNQIDVIKTWLSGSGRTMDKVPTEFTYENVPTDADATDMTSFCWSQSGATINKLKPVRWGPQLRPEESRIKCIKLFLDRNQQLPHFVSRSEVENALQKHDRLILEAASDFLHQIYKHIMKTLEKRFGGVFLKSTPTAFVLTVPAVWTDMAKQFTRQAAEHAGMGTNIRMISEPEAAAVYTLKAIEQNHLTVGQNIIVCDAGGGTVDLISYTITQLTPLNVKEAGVGTGGLCGAVFIDQRFRQHVIDRIGVARFQSMGPMTWPTVAKAFEEYVKPRFGEEGLDEFYIPFPGFVDCAEAGIESGMMILTGAQVKEMFDPVIAEVINLIEGQVSMVHEKAGLVSAIMLVGGFGQSIYLYNRVKSHFASNHAAPYSEVPTVGHGNSKSLLTGSRLEGSIEIMQPIDAWTAVQRGAVLHGLELGPMVSERKSRYHYGTTMSAVYQDRYPVSSRYWDELAEVHRARNAMSWYLRKGETVSEQRAVAIDLCMDYGAYPRRKGRPINHSSKLIACSLDTAPLMYSEDKDFLTVCTLDSNLTAVPSRYFKKHTNSAGKAFWRLLFTLEMRFDSASLEFGLKVGGHSYGSVMASFDH